MSRYRPDREGIGAMLCSERMQQLMGAAAQVTKDIAESTAPVYEQGKHPGRYKESFEVETGVREGRKTRRAFGRVKNHAPEALWVEIGSVHNEAHHTLAHALGATRL